MVLDTSAILAVLFDEPERATFASLIEVDPRRLVSTATRVEAAIVVESRKGERGCLQLDAFMSVIAAEIIPVGADHAEIACTAFRRFGKGRHPAGLNLGDVFAYALARAAGEPLLFKGGEFSRTDIASVA